jgi:hypothetical protein
VRSKVKSSFWEYLNHLPQPVQSMAREKFRVWQGDPFHPSLQFKEIRTNLWSVRINDNYRALGWRHGGLIVWFWIGAHATYDRLIK